MKLLLGLGIFGLLTSTIFTAIVFAGVRKFVSNRKRSQPGSKFAPPVTLLKPLHGAEPDLESHLATFFEQDYPEFEILFCARTQDDAGLKAAQRVAARYPKVPVNFVTPGEPKYINAKVSSLEKMMRVASHSLLVI